MNYPTKRLGNMDRYPLFRSRIILGGRLAEKNIPNCAANLSKTLVQIQGARQAHEPCNCRATHKLDDKDKQVGIFFDRNRLKSDRLLGSVDISPRNRLNWLILIDFLKIAAL